MSTWLGVCACAWLVLPGVAWADAPASHGGPDATPDTPDADTPAADTPQSATPDSEVVLLSPDSAQPMVATGPEHLAQAQRLRSSGNIEGARAEASAAIAADSELSAAYIARAQILAELADALAADTSDASRRSRARLLRGAAADLETYIRVAKLPEDAAAFFESRRQTLLDEAEAADPGGAPRDPNSVFLRPTPGDHEPASDADGRPEIIVPPARPDRADPADGERTWPMATAITGGAFALAAAGLASSSLRIEQSCDDLCGAAWTQHRVLFPAAIASGVLSAGLAPVGTYKWAENAKSPRAGRIAGITLLSASGVTSIVAAVVGGLAAARWRSSSPSDPDGLGSVQSLANAGAAMLAPTPSLIGSGVAALLGARAAKTRRSASQRRALAQRLRR